MPFISEDSYACAVCRQLWDLGCHLTPRACFVWWIVFQASSNLGCPQMSLGKNTRMVTKHSLPNTTCSVYHHIIPFNTPLAQVYHLIIPFNTTVMMMTVQFACFTPKVWSDSAPDLTRAFRFLFGLKPGKALVLERQKSLARCRIFPTAGNRPPELAGLEPRDLCTVLLGSRS